MTKQDYEYDALYQLTEATGLTQQGEDYSSRYEQLYEFYNDEDDYGLGRMTRKKSSTEESDDRYKGDNLDYDLVYEYEKGFAFRASRIGDRYYEYDANGNVITEQDRKFTDDPGEPITHTVTDLGNDTYVTDYAWGMKEGNPDNPGGIVDDDNEGYKRTYTWNERKLLKNSTENNSYNVNYFYGHDGERTVKYSTSDGGKGETIYFNKMWTWRYDGSLYNMEGQNSKHIYLGDTRIMTKIFRADDSFDQEEKTLKHYYYHSDHLGSAQLITNYDGEEYERIEYTPYGEIWTERVYDAESNIDIPYRFTGKELDEETGLYYYGARYMSPRESRWLSTDPALGDYIPGAPINDEAKKRNGELPGMGGVFNTVNMHLYHYAGNNPIKYTDPDGEQSVPFSFRDMWNVISKFDSGAKITNTVVAASNGDKAAQQNLVALGHGMADMMAESAGNALVTGMEFMSENGSYLAVASYASGNVVLGAVIDGITLACDITLAINEYNETGDMAGLVTSVTGIVATNAIGAGVGKAAASAGGLAKAELMKTLEPMIADLVSTAVNQTLKIASPED